MVRLLVCYRYGVTEEKKNKIEFKSAEETRNYELGSYWRPRLLARTS